MNCAGRPIVALSHVLRSSSRIPSHLGLRTDRVDGRPKRKQRAARNLQSESAIPGGAYGSSVVTATRDEFCRDLRVTSRATATCKEEYLACSKT